jgi:metallophosphoesterase (TIGR00282 family)
MMRKFAWYGRLSTKDKQDPTLSFREAKERDARRFDTVIIYAASRLSRDLFHALTYERELTRAGVEVFYALTAGDQTSPEGRLIRHMFQALDQFEVEKLGREVRRGQTENTKQGYRNGGRAPYGYRLRHEPHPDPARARAGDTKSRLVPDPERAPVMRRELRPDVVVVNAENSADSGQGVSPADAEELLVAGADVLTTGNHAFDGEGALKLLDSEVPILRPHNFHPHLPGRGHLLLELPAARLGVLNLACADLERVEKSPLFAVEEALGTLDGAGADATLIDIHGSWPAEKRALAHEVDGRVCAVLGTHTHVPTADAQVLGGGTAVLSDVGMTGASDSLIGFDHFEFIENLVNGGVEPRASVDLDGVLMGALVTTRGQRAESIERVERHVRLTRLGAHTMSGLIERDV